MPDFDRNSLEENHLLAMRFFEEGKYFPAHEAWETAWKQARGTGDAEFFKGLSQLGAGYVHLLRGNRHGAFTLMRRAAGRIGRYPPGHHGIATAAVAERARADAEAVEKGDLATGEDARFDRLPLRA
jgi:predicted metal-dependent hydrolase